MIHECLIGSQQFYTLLTHLIPLKCNDKGVFAYIVLSAWGLALASGSTAVMLGCGIADIKTAMETFPILFVPQLLFAGFFIKTGA
jgi:hypothetical protein